MDFCKDSLEASAYTLTLAMDKLASAVGMAHLYDIDRREFVVVFARGPGAMAVRGLRTSDADPLAAEAMRTPGAVMLRDGDDPRAGGRRWELLRAVAEAPIVSIACARVAQAGRFLGMIELANLEGGGAFAEGDEHALAYMAERFTEYVAAHGVVLGEER
jgi:GAF domain-containing protein